MQCGNCNALCAPGVDFCLVCKQPVEWDPDDPQVQREPEPMRPEEAEALEALRTVPQRDVIARQAYVRGTDRESLPPVVYSRFRSGPSSFPLPVKLIITVLILALAPVGGFWGFTVLFGVVYGPLAAVCLWHIWRKRSVGYAPTEEKHLAAGWVILALILAAIVIRALPKHYEYPCSEVGVTLTARLDENSRTPMERPAMAVPSGVEEGAWLVAARTELGIAVWATTADPATHWDGWFYTANDVAVEESNVGEYPHQDGLTPAMAARRDTRAIEAVERCVDAPAQPSPDPLLSPDAP